MPILKQLVAGSSQTKARRSRMDLTTEMISAPLGDFRHTMHVGRSGEAFGDTSFLSTRSGEPPRETEPAFPRSPKPGLLARTFRSSKRSHSMNRADQQQHENTLAPPDGSPTFVKNAMSLPFLNESDGEREDGGRVLKSLTSSPMRQAAPASAKSSNGALATGGQVLDLEQHEQLFGVLTDLRSHGPYNGGGGGGMKKAESVMSFHVDLGPSMLGDILDVMETTKDDDQGFEEGKGSEGRDSPQFSVHTEDEEGDKEVDEEEKEHKGEDIEEVSHDQDEEEEEEEEEKDEEVEENVKGKMIEAEIIENHSEESDPEQPQPEQQQYAELEQEQVKDVHVGVEDAQDLNDRATPRPPSSVDLDSQSGSGAPYTPELMPKHLQNSDSCSMSSTGSAAVADRPPSPSPQLLEVEEGPGMTRYSPPPPVEEGEFSSFIEDEDDEIRL
ncbi:cdc42 effector protein 4a [Engraulis encrasicolus]|uniref:cdc42 effector protein 4a n=1 Tax=Engraulis encrasicolus TaxID=184585 RepID=UPI002FD5C31E